MFTAKVFQNAHLPRGADEVHAIVSVSTTSETKGTATSSGPLVFGLMIDCSGSMGEEGGERLRHAKTGVTEAIAALRDDCIFFVIAGCERAELIVPPTLALAAHRETAREMVRGLCAGGGTHLSRWLELALEQFRRVREATPNVICEALLLTDGKNDRLDALETTLAECEGVFQCHARGVGVDWQVDELRRLAQRLLGTVDIIPEPQLIAEDFRGILGQALGRTVTDVRLRLWCPQGAAVLFCRQVSPELLDLTGQSISGAPNPQLRDFDTGSWSGSDTRDYHFAIRVKPGQLGQKMLAGRVSLVLGGAADAKPLAEAQVLAIWTDDEERTAVIDRTVAHYTGQGELAQAIQEGLAARQSGDADAATRKLGRAVQLAAELGNEGTTKLLRRVVDIVDEREGTVKLRRDIDQADAMALDTRSTRTRRLA